MDNQTNLSAMKEMDKLISGIHDRLFQAAEGIPTEKRRDFLTWLVEKAPSTLFEAEIKLAVTEWKKSLENERLESLKWRYDESLAPGSWHDARAYAMASGEGWRVPTVDEIKFLARVAGICLPPVLWTCERVQGTTLGRAIETATGHITDKRMSEKLPVVLVWDPS